MSKEKDEKLKEIPLYGTIFLVSVAFPVQKQTIVLKHRLDV